MAARGRDTLGIVGVLIAGALALVLLVVEVPSQNSEVIEWVLGMAAGALAMRPR
jgi:hypothetical protein